MKILIDNSNLFAGGGIQVAISFLYDLQKNDRNHDYLVVQSPKIAPLVDVKSFGVKFTFINIEQNKILIKRRRMKEIESKFQPDVIFSVFGPSYHKSKFLKVVGFAIPHLIYKNSPFFNTLGILKRIKIFCISKLKLIAFERNSDALIFETEDARSLYIKKYSSILPSFVVNNTINEVFYKEEKWNSLYVKSNKNYNILLLSANYPHKNLSIIPDVIRVLREKYLWNDFKFLLSVNKDDISFDDESNNFIEYLGVVKIESVPPLYQQIDVVFVPSLLEVFSTTYLEAMYMKKPIVASNMSFANDVCGNAAIFCDPLNPDSYAEAIYNIRENEQLKMNLIQEGIAKLERYGTSEERTLKYLNILEDVVRKQGN